METRVASINDVTLCELGKTPSYFTMQWNREAWRASEFFVWVKNNILQATISYTAAVYEYHMVSFVQTSVLVSYDAIFYCYHNTVHWHLEVTWTFN